MAHRLDTERDFDGTVDRILTNLFRAHPSEARWLGLHEYDGLVEGFRADAIDARLAELDQRIQTLDTLPATGLTAPQLHDRELLRGRLAFDRFQLAELREHRRNPLFYADPIDLSIYVKRTYALIDARVRGMAEHARAIPDLLAQARASLDPVLPRPVLEIAVDVFEGTATFIRDEIPQLLQGAGATVDVSAALASASGAVDEFVRFLRAAIERSDDGYAIGAERFSAMLRIGEMVDLPLERLLEIGEDDLERNLDAAREVAARIAPDQTVREIADAMAHDHPTAAELVFGTAALLEELRSFLIEREIVTVPSEVRCLVEETPVFLRWAFAMMDPAGPFETQAPESYYYVTPPESDWPPERQEEWLSMFARVMLRDISIHEAYPGHYVHFLHIARNPSRVRKVVLSYSFIEGWAHYVEQMMLEEGYGDGDLRLRLAQLREALVRNCRYVAAIKMHTQGMTVEEATRLFMEKSFSEEAPARQEAIRGTFDPGYLNYTLGKLMLLKLRDDYRRERGTAFSLHDFHDRVLALGAPPFPLARRALLREPGTAL